MRRALGAMRAHAPFLILLLVTAPLFVGFAWQGGLSTFNDDGFSYLTLARWMRGDPVLGAWAWEHAHFPPLFPLLLVATGGSTDFAIAHGVVAICAALSLVALYRFSAHVLESNAGALAVVALFVLTPTAWLGIKGILSESLYLLVSLCALLWHATRVARADAAARDRWIFGLLLALVVLTRTAGSTLVVAYLIHAAWRLARERTRAALVAAATPLVPVAIGLGAWALARPGSGSAYRDQAHDMLGYWLREPARLFHDGGFTLFQGWVSSFHAQTVTETVPAIVFGAIAAVAIAGAIVRAAANRLDGWYVLVTLPLLYFWIFPYDTTRRLLYPVFPLLLLQGGWLVLRAASSTRVRPYRRFAAAAAFLLPAMLCLPAVVVLAQKAMNRAPLAGTSIAYADILDYYLKVNEGEAREAARQQIATFAGLERTARETAPGARIMWARPEYVALLTRGDPVPFEYRWDAHGLAQAIETTHTDYLVLSEVYKLDRNLELHNPTEELRGIGRYADPVIEVKLPGAERVQFALMRIDRARLAAYLAAAGAPR